MKKLLGSVLAVALMTASVSANADSQFRQMNQDGSLPVMSGLVNYPTVSSVKALNSKIIIEKSGNEENFIKVQIFDVNQDGVIVLSEVVDMVNANFEAPDYTSLDDITAEDADQLAEIFNNLEQFVHLVKQPEYLAKH